MSGCQVSYPCSFIYQEEYRQKMSEGYEDIINLPHHVSTTRKHMSNYERAAQFSPFAALTGYEEDITETARRTDSQLNTSEDEEKLERLNRIIAFLRENAASHPRISVTYFVPDRRKDGGKYLSEEGCFKKTDEAEMSLCLTNGKKFYISDIYDIMLI